MIKIKTGVILGMCAVLQTGIAWANLNTRIVAYAPHAQLANNEVPAYSFKMDAKENVPYLATILRDGDAANHIELQQLVSTTNGNYSLQEVAPRIQIGPNSHKPRLILVPNANSTTTTPYIAYVDGNNNTLKLYQGSGTAPKITWKEIKISDYLGKDITNVQDLDVAVTQNSSLDIAVMDSQGKVDLLTTQKGLHYVIKDDPLRIASHNSAIGEGKAMRLVLSAMSGSETPYLVYSQYMSDHNWPMSLVQATSSGWTPISTEKSNRNLTINDKFDAIPCQTGICTFSIRDNLADDQSRYLAMPEIAFANDGQYDEIYISNLDKNSPLPFPAAAPYVASDGSTNYVIYTGKDNSQHCSLRMTQANEDVEALFTDIGEVSNLCTSYSALVMYPHGHTGDMGFALTTNPDGWYIIKAISFK